MYSLQPPGTRDDNWDNASHTQIKNPGKEEGGEGDNLEKSGLWENLTCTRESGRPHTHPVWGTCSEKTPEDPKLSYLADIYALCK